MAGTKWDDPGHKVSPESHSGGRQFDPAQLHQFLPSVRESDDPAMTQRSASRAFLAITLTSTALLKLVFAWRYRGFLTGDDLEIVLTAARSAVGVKYEPWAIRSLVHPLVLVLPVQKAGVLLGLASPRWLAFLACIPTVVFSSCAIAVLYKLARAANLSEPASRVATFLFALHWLPLTYGSTQYPRPITTCLLLLACLWIVRTPSRPASAFLAGFLVAAAFAVRWSEGAFLLPLLALCAMKTRSPRNVVALLGGCGAGVVLLVGVFDALTWGSPFAGLRSFLAFHSDPNNGSHLRAWSWYGSMVLHWVGPVLLLLVILGWHEPKSRPWIGMAAAFAAILSLSRLKELRYMQVCIPFLCIAGALGWERLRAMGRPGRWASTAALLCVAPIGLERTLHVLRQKSASAVLAAQSLASVRPPIRSVALEQQWAYGGRLYLGNDVDIIDVKPSHPLHPGALTAAIGKADVVALYEEDLDDATTLELKGGGFASGPTFSSESSPTVTVFVRERR
jgi:Alg9-like mannosyltransferase family